MTECRIVQTQRSMLTSGADLFLLLVLVADANSGELSELSSVPDSIASEETLPCRK